MCHCFLWYRSLMNLILEKGHSRVPVYYEQPTNIIGLVLVKNLLTIHPEDEVPVKSVTIRRIPRVPETIPLYDILNEFQKGHSHMAVVVRQYTRVTDKLLASPAPVDNSVKDVRVDIDDGTPLPKLPEEEEAVGIMTMEDVIEELLQEEIFDETDHHVEDS
ncbi:UNVERIFIED_CONTAM: DUF21 domain-containing protein [Sesamum angustifolium]|uniref:DUF21 domain-containing protein n=1 Tax=Sesamum angustifolium TaxID=2727405 RepID=A0AAW2QBV7_9LAMI